MDLTTVTTLISTVGFPIACCIFCAWYISTGMKEFRQTIENNTLVIKELTVLLKDKEANNENK